MSELVIKEIDYDIEVIAGQVRSNESDNLVLITKIETEDTYIATILRDTKDWLFKSSFSNPVSAEEIAEVYPYVLNDVVITVELKADATKQL